MSEIDWEKGTITPPEGANNAEPDWESGEIKPPVEPKGFLGAVRDTAVAGAAGAVTGVQLLANAAGADNAVSQKLGDAADYVRGFESEERREERAARAAKIKEAEESGSTWEEIKANVGAFGEAPIDTTVEALGTSLPTIAATALTRGKLRAPVAGAVGAAQGAGTVKGAIYDAVEQQHLEAGATPEEAKARAAEAQAYDGDNAGQIALGAGLGVAAGTTGVEGAIGRLVGQEAGEAAAQGLVRSTLLGAAKEAPMEAAQGGQERLASNLALQNEGFDTPTWQGVAGQAALEGVAGAAAGGGFGAVEGMRASSPQPAPGTEPAVEEPAATQTDDAVPVVEPAAEAVPPAAGPLSAGMAPPQVPQQYRTERPYPAKPSEQMGLDPAAGALSDAAATAVDSGATAQLAQQAAEQQAAEQVQKGAKAGEKIDTSTGEIPQAAGDLLAGDPATDLQDQLNFVQQQARATGWDARLVAERDRLRAELDKLQPPRGRSFADTLDDAAKEDNAVELSRMQALVDAGRLAPDAANAIVERAIRASKIARDKGIVADYLQEAVARATGAPYTNASTIDRFDGEGVGDLDVKAARAELARRDAAEQARLNAVPPTSVQEGIAQAQARRAIADQADVSPETVTAPAPAEASNQIAVKDAAPAVEPPAPVETAADQTGAGIAAITAKQIPDMSDAEIEQAIAHYGPDHKRTAKLQKEQAKRATQGVGNVPQAAQAVEASPQPAQVAGQAPANSAQAAGAADAGSPASVDHGARWEAMSRDERQALAVKSGVKPVFAKSLPGAPWDRIGDATRQKLIVAMNDDAPSAEQGAAQVADPHIERMRENKRLLARPSRELVAQAEAMGIHDADQHSNVESLEARMKARQEHEGRDIGDGWHAFHPDSGTVGIPRAEMPQIKAEHRGAMVNFLNARGVQHQESTVPASALRPTQAEFSRAKVAKAKAFDGGNRSILISQDGHVLDGHHQWLAAREKGEDVKVIRLDAPIRELVKLAHEFPSSTTDAASESATSPSETVENKQADEYAARLRKLGDEFQGSYSGRSLAPLARAMADHAIEQGRRLTDAEIADLGKRFDVPADVVEQLTGNIFTFDALLGDAQRREPGAVALRKRQSQPSITAENSSKAAAGKPAEYGSNNRLVSADRAAELRAKLAAKLNGSQLNSGLDPEILAMGTELAIFHLEASARRFAEFARLMADDLGQPLEKIRPYLRGWYNGARDNMEDQGVSIEGMDNPDEVRAALAELDAADFPLKEAADSYSGISHSGRARAKADAEEYARYIDDARESGMAVAHTDAQKAAVAQAVADLRVEYLANYRRLMSVRAGTYSGHVAGRSGLNSKQANQRNNAYDRAIETFTAWQSANTHKARKAALDARTEDEKAADKAAADQAREDKAQKERDADLTLMRKILSWKKGGEPVAITKTAVLDGVNKGRDGYPTSIKLKPTDGSTLLDDKFDLAALFRDRKRGESVPESKRRVRELVDAVRAEAATEAAQDAVEQEQSPAKEDSTIPLLQAHEAAMEQARDGKIEAEAFRATFAQVEANREAILAELNSMNKEKLLRAGGVHFYHRYKSEKKDRVVEALYRSMLDEYALGKSYGPTSYMMTAAGMESHRQAKAQALRDLVAGTDADALSQYAAEVAELRKERESRKEATQKALTDPQTLAEFRSAITYNAERHAETRREAYLRLTPEQRRRYDALEAESTREARDQAKANQRTKIASAGNTTPGEVIATKHTKHGHDLFVVKLEERVSREDYDTLNNSAKRMGGSYSSYRGNGAIPGFQFRTREAAEAFRKLVAGDTTAAQEVAQARRDAFEDDRSQSAVERLRTMAAALNERADEELGRDRKVNTARRARMASAAEGAANANKALAGTMSNIADAIEAGKAKFLDLVRQKVQVEFLNAELRNAKDAQIRAKYPSYADQERHRGQPIDDETVDYSAFPTYGGMRSDLAGIARQMIEVDGLKNLGQRLLKVADDVSDAYVEWAKNNLLSVSHFARGEKFAEFANRDDAERAIRRANLSDRAIVLPLKRGVNRIVLSPSEAMKQGIWQGDDKRIDLSGDFGREIVEAVGRRAGSKIKLPWQLETVHAKRKRLEGMGIYTGSEYRAALREFAELQQAMATPDKIKQMERAMIGRRSDGLDFFPTSEAVVDAMLEAAEIEEGMGVLEPSAGMGHISDAIREKTGVEPDVVELSGERRELLAAKGYHLVGDDFMAMQPRSFYTFGDVFQAPDGTKGIMHGGAAWSGRASLHAINEDGSEGKMLGWYDRDELTGIEQRGSWSGYDRIIMNPPFSKGRDIQHIQHAYSLLKPGGRLVAIMGEGAFFQSNNAAEGFRAWLDDLGATSERLPENSFMDAALPVNTAVNARMVVIDKPQTDTSGITADSARRAAVRARVAANNDSREDRDFLQGLLKGLYAKTGDGVLEHKLSTWLDSRYQRLEAVDQLYAAHDKAFAGKDEVLFSRQSPEEADGLSQSSVVTGKAPANPLTLAEAIAAADKFLADYNGHIELSYRIRKTQDELYGPGSIAKIGVVKGAYHPGRGLFTLTADHLSSVADTVETLRHELLGHYGLDTFEPADKQALLDKILASKDDPSLKVVWGEIARLYSDKSDSVQAEEVFARLAEGERSGKEKLADLLYSLLTRLLRKVFGYKKGIITRRELLREIEVISKGIRNGSRPRQTFDSETNQRRGTQTDTEAFRRWFGKSKVVGVDGQPMNLYHGTAADFTVFDQGRAGSATGHATSALGIFMSSDRRAAQNYAEKASDGMPGYGRVMDLYASIQNPYLMSVEESQEVESPLEARRLRTRLEQQGYDGIRLKGTPVWIAFNNYQVKSATDNNGDFDEFDPDIRFSRSSYRDMARNAADAIASVSVQDVKRSALGKWTDFLSLGLQSLGRRQLVDLYDGMLPMRKYAKLVERMDADKNDTGAAADELAQRWGKLKDGGKLADLMHEATLAQTDADPLVPESKAVNPGQRDALIKRFEQLTPEAQAIYREARDAYKDHHRSVIEAIKERVKRSEMGSERKEELLRKMDSEFYKAIQGVYFPLARFGSYVVAVNGPDGKIASVHRAETMGEANALRDQLQQKFPRDSGYDVGKVTLDKEFVASRDSVSRGFMSELYGALDGMNLPSSQLAELEDTLGQLYLASMPDLSWAKHGIHRKGTAGFSDDARRAFAQNMFHGARYLAKLRYGDRMQDELDRMQKHADARKHDADYDQPKAQRVIDEMVKRHESMMNPKSNPLSTALTSFGFIYYLGLSPAAAVVNLTQTALVAYPVMGAKWGFNKSAAALMKASNQAVRGKNDITQSLTPEELKAFEKAVRDGTIDVTQAHDLAGIAQGEDSKVMWKIRPVMRMASFMFHQAEVFNRQVTFVASYRLAREAGASTTAAYEQAKKATYDGHFDYSASNRPRLMQGNVAKVVLLFKQYAQNMLYTLTRNAYQSVAGESPAVRKEARKTIGAILALHAAATGVLGLPLVGTMLALASAVGGDDDEPWDAEAALRNLLADALGPKASEVIARGLSRLGPADISGRVALNSLLLPDVQEGLEGKKLAEAWTSAMLGPVAGIFTNAAVGANHIAEGRYAMGLESMLPVALRNPLKSLRYADEGVVDRSGVVVRDEVGAAGIASQLLGFSPSEVRLSFEGKSAVFDADRRLSSRRSDLMAQFARAAMEGDQEGMAEARAAITAFNQKNPSRRIQANHLMQSVQARRRRIAQAEDGIYLPRNRADAREAGRFANPE